MDPANLKAIAGLARCYLAGGDVDQARQIAGMAPADAKDADLEGVRAALKLADEAPSETAAFEQRLARDAFSPSSPGIVTGTTGRRANSF